MLQAVVGGTQNIATLDNNGVIDISVMAVAAATGLANAHAGSAFNGYFGQGGSGSAVDITPTNDGFISLAAIAEAEGDERGHANVGVTWAITQGGGGGSVTVAFNNNGEYDYQDIAHASGATSASASIGDRYAFSQFVQASTASLAIENAGNIEIHHNATAMSPSGRAFAQVGANEGLHQQASATAVAIALDNQGQIDVHANAIAEGGVTATASVLASGIAQDGFGKYNFVTAHGLVQMSLVNSGTIAVGADAHAIGGSGALAVAGAVPWTAAIC